MQNLNSLLWNSSASFRDVIALLKNKKELEITGLASLTLPSFLKAIYEENFCPILFITSQESLNSLHKISNQLKRLDLQADILPSAQTSFLDGLGESEHYFAKISSILNNWLNNNVNGFTIASTKSLVQPIMKASKFKKQQIILEKKQNLNLSNLLKQLVNLGYQRVDTVFDIGSFALRGDILDIFSAGEIDKLPFRINLFGDEIESIKLFEPWTQRSIKTQELEKIIVPPSKPFSFDFSEKIVNLQNLIPELDDTQAEFWRQDLNNSEWQRFIPWLEDEFASPLEYFSDNGLVIIEEPLALKAYLERIYERFKQELDHKLQRKHLPNSQKELLEKTIDILQNISSILQTKRVLKIHI